MALKQQPSPGLALQMFQEMRMVHNVERCGSKRNSLAQIPRNDLRINLAQPFTSLAGDKAYAPQAIRQSRIPSQPGIWRKIEIVPAPMHPRAASQVQHGSRVGQLLDWKSGRHLELRSVLDRMTFQQPKRPQNAAMRALAVQCNRPKIAHFVQKTAALNLLPAFPMISLRAWK